MSVAARVDSDAQLARLLQIGVVLEEVVEVRAHRHYQTLPAAERDDAIEALLEDARSESADHRRRLEALIDALDADPVPVADVEDLVLAEYASEETDFDGVLYDQLNGEETAYKFYDDLLAAVEASDATFGVDRERLRETLLDLREDEAEGAEEVTDLMEERT